MNAATKMKPDTHPEITITRTFHAPRRLVWQAWTDAEHLREWWGPHTFSSPMATVDLRVGGIMRIDMRGPDGSIFPMKAMFREIVRPERLVYLDSAFENEKGIPQLEILTTVTFAEDQGKTTVTVHSQVLHVAPEYAGMLAGMEDGWSQSLERLGGHVGSLVLDVPDGEPIIIMSRLFDAPRELVWKAITDPKHLKHWWGLREATNIVCEMDARPGGKWRIHQRYPDGSVFKFRGEVREVVPPEKIVQTFGMEGMYEDRTIVETLTLTEVDGKTLYKVVSRFMGFEDRAGMIASGVSYGAQETYDRLAEYLRTM